MVNVCVLVGRIASDPEVRYAASGTAVVHFRIAVDRIRKVEGQPDADFLDIVAFGKTGEFVAQYLDKGCRVGVDGRIQSRTWQANDGQTRYTVEIVANSVQQLETRQESEMRRASRGGGGPRPMPPPPTQQPGQAAYQQPAQQPAQPAYQAPQPTYQPPAPPAQEYGPIGDGEDPFADQ